MISDSLQLSGGATTDKHIDHEPQHLACCCRSSDKIEELRDMIKDVQPQPELVAGMQGMCEVAVHPDAEAVITGIVGCAGAR